MPLTEKGEEILGQMRKTYPSEKKAKEVFYASRNKGTITGVDSASPSKVDQILARCADFDKQHP